MSKAVKGLNEVHKADNAHAKACICPGMPCPCPDIEALRDSEKKYRLLAENAVEVIWTMTLDGKWSYISPSVERLSGYTVEEAKTLPMEAKMTPASVTDFMDGLAKHMALPPDQRPLSKTMRFEMICKDGTTIWTEATIRIITDEQGNLTGFQGSTRDISEQIHTSEALADSEHRFQTILRALPDMVVGMDTKGHITFYHTPDPKMLPMPPEVFMDKAVSDVMSPYIKGFFLSAMEKNRRNEVADVEFCLEREGQYKCYSAKVSPMFFDNEYRGSVAVVRDISEKKLNERNVRRTLIKFDLKAGNLYMVKESSSHLGREAFKELVDVGYHGIRFSRDPPPKVTGAPKMNEPRWYWLTQRGTDNAIPPEPAKIEAVVIGCPTDCAVIIENLEYVMQNSGFEAALALIQHIKDLAFARGHIIIVSLDPMFMSARQLKFFEKEAHELLLKAKQRIEDDLAQMLKYVYEQNLEGRKPKYSDVSQDLDISKPTTRKRIARLTRLGLLIESQHGKSKVLETTEKGRSHFTR